MDNKSRITTEELTEIADSATTDANFTLSDWTTERLQKLVIAIDRFLRGELAHSGTVAKTLKVLRVWARDLGGLEPT